MDVFEWVKYVFRGSHLCERVDELRRLLEELDSAVERCSVDDVISVAYRLGVVKSDVTGYIWDTGLDIDDKVEISKGVSRFVEEKLLEAMEKARSCRLKKEKRWR